MSTKKKNNIYLVRFLLAITVQRRDLALNGSLTNQLKVRKIANNVKKKLERKKPPTVCCVNLEICGLLQFVCYMQFWSVLISG